MLGVDAAAAVGKEWSSFVHPDDRARAVAAWDGAVASLSETTIDCRIVRANGEVAFVRADVAPRDAEGREWVSSLANVTPEREAILRLFMQAPAAIAILRGPEFV